MSLEQRFVDLVHNGREHEQLVELMLLLSKLEDRSVTIEACHTRLDMLGMQAQVRIDEVRSADQRVAQLCRFLAREQGIQGNTEDYYAPSNSLLSELLKTRRGIPISLAFVYIHIANVMGWLARGVAFPGHFLVAVYDGGLDDLQGGGHGDHCVLLDPFRGVAVSRDDCLRMLRKQYGDSAQLQERFFYTADNSAIIRRMLRNLKQCYIRKAEFSEALRVVNLLLQIAPSDVSELHDRAAILEYMHCYSAAAADLQTISRERPDHPRLVEIKNSINRLEKLAPQTVH